MYSLPIQSFGRVSGWTGLCGAVSPHWHLTRCLIFIFPLGVYRTRPLFLGPPSWPNGGHHPRGVRRRGFGGPLGVYRNGLDAKPFEKAGEVHRLVKVGEVHRLVILAPAGITVERSQPNEPASAAYRTAIHTLASPCCFTGLYVTVYKNPFLS